MNTNKAPAQSTTTRGAKGQKAYPYFINFFEFGGVVPTLKQIVWGIAVGFAYLALIFIALNVASVWGY